MVRKHKKKMRKKSSEIAFYGKKTRTKLLMLIYHLRLDCAILAIVCRQPLAKWAKAVQG